ncbi:DDE-type integrase/transposase/recombinase [Lachnospiraceae bacterium OttesenSCG-928-D06]|nr:DDE-type integrase/transposase/recombinase [Lachnospiraceae bacterium OttesenSCG-928-D06]
MTIEKKHGTEESKREIALFRFSLIAPVVANTYQQTSKMDYYRKTCESEHQLPNGKKVKLSPLTLKKWYQKYTTGGLEALIPHTRIDLGQSRLLSEDVCKQIHAYRKQFPYITGKKIYEKLIEQGYIKKEDVSIDTVYRYLKSADLTRGAMSSKECLAFEFEHANDCWQADTTMGPIIVKDGKHRQTYLIAFIDDASRLLVQGEFFFEDNAINMQKTFQKAILKFGIPKRLFVDNGCSYQNNQLNWICAELGIVKIHSRPYHPRGKAKIERSHRTEKDRWMNCTDWNSFHSLEEVNSSYQRFLDTEYNNGIHSSICMTPKERYLKDFHGLRFLEKSVVEECFLHRITRKVTQTATVSVFKTVYEVPQHYIGQTIHLRYQAEDMSQIYIYEGESKKRLHTVYPVKKLDNAMRKRRANIPYGVMDGGALPINREERV